MSELADAFARVDALFERFQADGHAPALAYGVVVDGRLAHVGGFGSIDPHDGGSRTPDADSVFRIASMSKSFTAAAALMLRDDGMLHLDDPVADYVPQLRGLPMPTADSPALSIRHLLTMSGGLPTDDPWGDRQESLDRQGFSDLLRRGFRFVAAPGTGFEYSNLGFAILGRVVQNLHEGAGWAPTGLPGHTGFHDFVLRRILDPLGMADTGYGEQVAPAARLAPGWRRAPSGWQRTPPVAPGAFSAMGGLHSTVRDLARWVGGFLDAFPARDDPPSADGHPLPRAARREMQQQHRAADLGIDLSWPDEGADARAAAGAGPALSATAVGYGFGLFVERVTGRGEIISHSGGYPGYGSHMRWHPASGIGVIALANATYAGPARPARQALDVLLDAVAEPSRRARPAWPDTLAAAASIRALLRDGADEAQLGAARQAGLFAMNIALDQPDPERAAALADVARATGLDGEGDADAPAGGDATAGIASDGPAHARWTDRGPRGRRAVSIRLSPELAPRVQTLAVTAIVAPSPQLLAAARAVIADPAGPIAALSGAREPILDMDPIEADSPLRATFAIAAGAVRWQLSIAVDDAGAVLRSALRAIA